MLELFRTKFWPRITKAVWMSFRAAKTRDPPDLTDHMEHDAAEDFPPLHRAHVKFFPL